MTLDEAIKHCEEVAERHDRIKQIKAVTLEECKCADEHRQLATWLRELKQLREQMSNSEKPNKWIPVSEAMPIIGQDVLVCDIDGDMYITYLHTDGGWGFNYTCTRIRNVVAWQELPLPYKVESEDEK